MNIDSGLSTREAEEAALEKKRHPQVTDADAICSSSSGMLGALDNHAQGSGLKEKPSKAINSSHDTHRIKMPQLLTFEL